MATNRRKDGLPGVRMSWRDEGFYEPRTVFETTDPDYVDKIDVRNLNIWAELEKLGKKKAFLNSLPREERIALSKRITAIKAFLDVSPQELTGRRSPDTLAIEIGSGNFILSESTWTRSTISQCSCR